MPLLPRVRGGQQVLAARLDPLDGHAEPSRQQRQHQLLGIDLLLDAEPAADVGRDHAHPVLGESEDVAEDVPERVRPLRRRPERELTGPGVPVRDDPPRLERHPGVAVNVVAPSRDDLRCPKCSVDVADLHGEGGGQVVAQGLVQHRGARRRGPRGVRDGIERLVFDRHGGGAVLGRVPALGDDQRHRLPHIPDGGGRQGLLGLVVDQRRVGDEPGERAAEVAQIGVRQHRHHGAGGPRAARVDPHDAGVGMGAAKHRRVRQAREVDVIDEQAAAAQQRRILVAGDARARVACAHRRKAPSMERRSTPILGRPDPAGGARSRRANSSG